MKNDKISKENKEISRPINPNNKITSKHLTSLDNFIQQCLDKFKFIDPKQEFYDATGNEKDLIISHKSTIPDLVIWNKRFNKNECFEEGNTKKGNPFPRFQFYLRIKSNKPDKDKKKEKKNEKDKDIEKNNHNNKKKDNKEGKNKNKKKQENKNNNLNNNNNANNNIINNGVNINNNNNNDLNINVNFSKSEKKISDLSDLDINKIKEFNPRHKNNFFSSNKEIMNLNDNENPLFNDNKYGKNRNLKEIGINGDIGAQERNLSSAYSQDFYNMPNRLNLNNFKNSKSTEITGNNDIKVTINNNNYIQQYQYNNNNNINRLININNINNKNKNDIFKDMNNYNYNLDNLFIENKMKENPIVNLINFYSTNKGWILKDASNGNIFGVFNSFELYINLSKQINLKKVDIIDIKQQFKLSGDYMFNILSILI